MTWTSFLFVCCDFMYIYIVYLPSALAVLMPSTHVLLFSFQFLGSLYFMDTKCRIKFKTRQSRPLLMELYVVIKVCERIIHSVLYIQVYSHIYIPMHLHSLMMLCSVLGVCYGMLHCYKVWQRGDEREHSKAGIHVNSCHSVCGRLARVYMVTIKICYAASAFAVFTENKLNFGIGMLYLI